MGPGRPFIGVDPTCGYYRAPTLALSLPLLLLLYLCIVYGACAAASVWFQSVWIDRPRSMNPESPQRAGSPDLPDPTILVAAAEANTKRAEAALVRAEAAAAESAQHAAQARAEMLEERAGCLHEQEMRLNVQQELLHANAGEHSEESLPPAETHDNDLPVPHDGKSTLKFVEPKKFSGSEDSRPIDVFLDSAERWLRFGAKSPPPVEQWAMYASSLLTGQAEKHFSVVSRQSAINLADMSWAKFCSIMKGAYSRIKQDFAACVEFHEIEQKHDQDVNSLVR